MLIMLNWSGHCGGARLNTTEQMILDLKSIVKSSITSVCGTGVALAWWPSCSVLNWQLDGPGFESHSGTLESLIYFCEQGIYTQLLKVDTA